MAALARLPTQLQSTGDGLPRVPRSGLPLSPKPSLRCRHPASFLLPSPRGQCTCGLCPLQVRFFPLTLICLSYFGPFLLPSVLSGPARFAALSDFGVCSNRKKAGKREIVGSTSRGWESPERERVAHSLCTEKWQPFPALNTAGASQAPFPTPHPPFLLHWRWFPVGPLDCACGLELGTLIGVILSRPNLEQAWPGELPPHRPWPLCFRRPGMGPRNM